jgi:predicted amidohydrolase YtcJ
MSSKCYHIATLVFTISLLLSLVSACTTDTVSTPTLSPPTPPPPSPIPTQLTNYTLRIEFTSSADWADLKILNPDHILSADLESVRGNPSKYNVTPAGLAIDQSLSAAKNGDIVGLTVDYVLDSTANEQPLYLQLQRGSINECAARIYRLVGDDYQLVLEVENQGERGTDGKNTLDFSLDLNTMAEVASEAATIIFYNGVVLTMEPDQPQAQAIAILGDHILAVGSNEEITLLAESDTQLIDLEGHTLLPGLADGHSHIFWVPPNMTLDEVQDLVLGYGYTTVTEMTSEADHLERLLQAEEDGRMRMRVNVFVTYNNTYPAKDRSDWLKAYWFPENDPILDSDRMVRIPGVKFFSDEARCPALRDPWPDNYFGEQYFQENCDSIYGDSYWPDLNVLNQAVVDAQAAGYSAAIHAFGDRGIEDALNAIAYALDGESNLIYRHQIQHSSYLSDDLLQRYVDMDMLTSVRGYFNTCDQDFYHTHAIANRYALPGLGVHAYLETDTGWPGDPTREYISATINPLVHLWGLVTHQQMLQDGTICLPEPWLAEKVITVEQALRMMTYEPIFAVRQEDVLGSLALGKYADMIILSDNPLTIDPDDLKDLEVWMTMVGGNTEYCAPGHEEYCP